jgi:hypothetical protein
MVGEDSTGSRLSDAIQHCPLIGATLSREPGSPLGRVVGDLLVLYPSASGQGRRRRIPFEADHGRHFGGMNHFHLLRHPAVYEQLRSWLEPGV